MVKSADNIRELIRHGERYLVENGVPNARRNAEWMLSEVLGCRSADLYLYGPRVLEPTEIEMYDGFLKRRAAREPLQYILRSTEFMSLPFLMSPGVFIPRPDSEIVVEVTESYLGRRSPRGLWVLDLCCGSGVIAVSLVKRHTGLSAVAVDVDDSAVLLAARNAIHNGVADRVECVHMEAIEFLTSRRQTFDVIVSNPPYVPTDQIELLSPEIRGHEPVLSLDGGEDGVDFYREAAPFLRDSLEPGGIVVFEMASFQGAVIGDILREASLSDVEVHRDYAGFDRVIAARRPLGE